MMGNNHKTALHDFIRRVFSAVLFRFAWLIAFHGDLLVLGSGLVLEVIKSKTDGFYHLPLQQSQNGSISTPQS